MCFSTCGSVYFLLDIHSYCHDIDIPDRKNDDHYMCGSRFTDIVVFGKLFTGPQSNLTTSFSLSSHGEKGEMETRMEIFSTIF